MHHVVPGSSWGTLSIADQQKWLDWHCDKFFCHKHHLEGKGVYSCKKLLPEVCVLQQISLAYI